ncbi:FIST signal transduction protein [Desulfocurvus sp. DL9XJH121]
MENAEVQLTRSAGLTIALDSSGTVEGFKSLLDAVGRDPGVRGVLVLACQENGFTPVQLDPVLRAAPVEIFGGVFPGIVHGVRSMTRGTIMVGIRCPLTSRLVPGQTSGGVDFDLVLDEFGLELKGHRTMLVFVDGKCSRISEFMESLFVIFGLEFNYLGGGAGIMADPSGNRGPSFCILTSQGMAVDTIQLVALDMDSRIGVGHGWRKLAGPFMVTATRGARILSLDWRPAGDVFREVVNGYLGRGVEPESLLPLVPHFPLGIEKFQAEHIVREIVAVDGDDLVFSVDIPEGAFVHIMTGDQQSLIRAAGEAYDLACGGEGAACGDKVVLVMDCCTRWQFLRQGFEQELELLNRDGLPLVGALSQGEIANSGRDSLEFLNKTCVVGMVGD